MAALEIGPADRPIGVIFSHANGFDARLYTSILEPVAALTRILAIDLRGHGRTSLPTVTEGRESWNDLRDDLLAVMTETDVEDVVLAGHSMGATSSLLAAVAAPGRVRSLVLFEPVILEGGEGGRGGRALGPSRCRIVGRSRCGRGGRDRTRLSSAPAARVRCSAW